MSTPVHQQFVALLERIAAGVDSQQEWERLVVTHHADPDLESARCQLVRASISAGSWSWSIVPIALQQVAAELAEHFRVSGA